MCGEVANVSDGVEDGSGLESGFDVGQGSGDPFMFVSKLFQTMQCPWKTYQADEGEDGLTGRQWEWRGRSGGGRNTTKTEEPLAERSRVRRKMNGFNHSRSPIEERGLVRLDPFETDGEVC